MSPRKRKIKTEYNIKYVHFTNSRIVYRPYIKKSERKNGLSIDKNGFLKPPISLGKEGDHPDKIFQNYLIAKEQIKSEKKAQEQTLGWLVEMYEDSRAYKELASSSQKRNKNLRKILDHHITINGKNDTLENLHIKKVTKPLFQMLAEKRLKDYIKAGRKGVVQVNREITFISSTFNWATNYIANLGISQNPLKGFKKLKENENERYVTDKEYSIQFNEAAHISDYLQPIFELTYLLATRGIETLDIRLSDCSDEGIRTHRRKGSKDNIIAWSDRLNKAYKLALERHRNFKTLPIDPYLIMGFSGGKLTKSTLDDAMQRLKKNMEKKGLGDVYWSLHKLKSKGVSDSDNKNIAGHKTEQMRQKYDTKIQVFQPVK